ncbi:hypothetical protein V500_04488, partial [Pseudogymnoascus sp. VKM F-4518 (FW-2643)]
VEGDEELFPEWDEWIRLEEEGGVAELTEEEEEEREEEVEAVEESLIDAEA